MSVTYEQKAPAALEQLKLTTALAQLDSVSQQAAAASWSYSHFLGYLLEAELQERHRRTVRLNLHSHVFLITNGSRTSTTRRNQPSIAA